MSELEKSPKLPPPRQSDGLFILIGVLWLALGGFILSQLPDSRSKFITIEWETETETDTAGFNIYRAPSNDKKCEDVEDSEYEQVNNVLETSKGTATSGSNYTYEDDSVQRGVDYCYQLEDIELSGTTTRHDPIVGPRLRQIDRILYMILAPICVLVGLWMIVSVVRKGD